MKFRIDLKIFILAILFYFTRQIETYALVMIFAIIHELGHLIAGIVLNMKPEKLEITPAGISVSFKIKIKDINVKIKKANLLEIKKIIVAIAGPITNLIIIIIAYNLNVSIVTKLTVVYANILIILFNLIPIYPLDGGRILKGILYVFYGNIKSEKYINNISIAITILLTALASIMILKVHNIAILIAIFYIWIIVIKENIIYKNRKKLYDKIEEISSQNYEETLEK